MANTLTVMARLRAAKGKGDALASLLTEQAAAVRASEPGCIDYRVHRSTTDPEVFVFYERYVDDAAFAAHKDAPHILPFRQRRQQDGLADGPIAVEFFRSITE